MRSGCGILYNMQRKESSEVSTVLNVALCAFSPHPSLSFWRSKVLHCDDLYPPWPPPPLLPVVNYSLVMPAFSPNINPNRLSTEGYCSSSQKRRQIFRYWGAAALVLLCCHAHTWKWISDDSGDLCFFKFFLVSLLGLVHWLMAIPLSTAPWGSLRPMHGCFVVSLRTDWCTLPLDLPSTATIV